MENGMLEEAIAHYHALLDPDTARATQQQLTDEQRARNLFFGERPLMSVLRPRFITADQYALFQRACGLVAGAAQRLAPALLEDSALRADLALTPGEERLIAMHPGYAEPSAHSRMDTFLSVDGSSLQFVEYNGESPGASACLRRYWRPGASSAAIPRQPSPFWIGRACRRTRSSCCFNSTFANI